MLLKRNFPRDFIAPVSKTYLQFALLKRNDPVILQCV